MKRRKRCDHCGELNEDVIDGLCAECESDYFVYCTICKEWIDRDDGLHRHLFWTDCGFGGSGSNETEVEAYREDVISFLQLLSLDVLVAIRRAILKSEFSLTFSASMLGGFSHIYADGIGWNFYCFHDLFDQMNMSSDESTGLQWIFTLYKEETKEANALALQWIEEVLAAKSRHASIMEFHEVGA